jgi:hypothetical protein
MATTLASDLKIYEAQFQSGMTETLQQNIEAFNAASNGGIVLRSSEHKGNYEYNAFFKSIASLITRQDITSDSALTATKIAQEEAIAVKLHRKMATDLTYKAAKMAGIEFDAMVFAHGEQFAKAMMNESSTARFSPLASLSQVKPMSPRTSPATPTRPSPTRHFSTRSPSSAMPTTVSPAG